jgi:hypothetical protein
MQQLDLMGLKSWNTYSVLISTGMYGSGGVGGGECNTTREGKERIKALNTNAINVTDH